MFLIGASFFGKLGGEEKICVDSRFELFVGLNLPAFTEIGELGIEYLKINLMHEDIIRLDISVELVTSVQVGNTLADLLENEKLFGNLVGE